MRSPSKNEIPIRGVQEYAPRRTMRIDIWQNALVRIFELVNDKTTAPSEAQTTSRPNSSQRWVLKVRVADLE